MKIPLPAQIEEAERHRDDLKRTSDDLSRLHRSEAICLTLAFVQTYEPQFRQFMATRKEEA